MSIRHAMLALLSEGPGYGARLREEFEARTGDVWPLNVGQVYTTLQRLERDGLIEGTPGSGDEDSTQKSYRITEDGVSELARWLRTPPDLSSPPRDELVMKVLVALRVPGTDVRDVIQAHRRYLIELMQQWTLIKEAEAADDLYTALAVDAELFRLDSVVRWLDAAEARIRRAPAGRHPGPADRDPGQADHPSPADQPSPADGRPSAAGSGRPAPRETQSRSPLPRHRRGARAQR
jgi:DNA-binding PadR family transcriptional regulator